MSLTDTDHEEPVERKMPWDFSPPKESETKVISLDGAKIPMSVTEGAGIQAVLTALALMAPPGHLVEKIDIRFLLAKSA